MMDMEKDRHHWDNRSRTFANLEWASRSDYLQAMVQAADLSSGDLVLDVGTGTGIVARAVAPFVERVIGVDISPEMINASLANHQPHCEFQIADVRKLSFPTGYFSRAFARMVFHGLIDTVDIAVQECYRVLQPGGKFIISEGIPPSLDVEPWYTEMFRLKEERLTFSSEILEDLLRRAGFTDTRTHIHVSPQVSIANWLDNGDLSSSQRQKLMLMHFEMPDVAKRDYRATFNGGSDVLLDMKFAIVVGTKP